MLMPTKTLPEGKEWTYELKLDGYRAEVIKTDGHVQLKSKHDKSFNSRFPAIVEALAPLPDETVVDGEIVALQNGRPSFKAPELQIIIRDHLLFPVRSADL